MPRSPLCQNKGFAEETDRKKMAKREFFLPVCFCRGIVKLDRNLRSLVNPDNVVPLDKCPDPRTLEQLLQGKLPAVEFEFLCNHREKCSTCTKMAETLAPVDKVSNAIKAVMILRGDEELLAQAMERGKQFGSQAPSVRADGFGNTMCTLQGSSRAESDRDIGSQCSMGFAVMLLALHYLPIDA